MVNDYTLGPVPPLEKVAIKLTSPIEEGPPDIIPGLLPSRGELVIAGETNVGKAQPLDAKVLTPTGWKSMGELCVGDVLASPDNQPTRVVAIHPRGVRQVFRLTLTDGRSTEACADHLWRVSHPDWRRGSRDGYRLLTTQELIALSPMRRRRVCIETPDTLDYGSSKPMPIDPWLLGVLLGDGCLSQEQVAFTTADTEVVSGVERALGRDLVVHKLQSRYAYSIVQRNGPYTKGVSGVTPNPFKETLRDLGLMGCKSGDKFIPECYMQATRDVRERLIAGLIDTDGYVSQPGSMVFTTVSPRLAEQVTTLVRSIGGVCSTRTKHLFYKDKTGTRREGQLAYNLYIACVAPRRLTTLSRKLSRLPYTRRRRLLKFKDIVASRVAETQCITVSHPNGVYITDDFIVTHNSLLALEIVSCVSTGTPLWGELMPLKRLNKVLYVLGEHYNEVIQRLWQVTGLPMGEQVWLLGPEQLGIDKWLVTQGRQNSTAITKFVKWAEGSDMIVFDPFSAFVTGVDVENDNITMRLVLDSMSFIAQSTGASCLVLAHQGKPMMDKFGHEQKRKSYAIRGASAIEDAATNIFYMGKSDTPASKASDDPVFELLLRKYKGEAPADYQLRRDPKTLTHRLLGDRPYDETLRIEANAMISRFQIDFPNIDFNTAIRHAATALKTTETSIRRRIGAERR